MFDVNLSTRINAISQLTQIAGCDYGAYNGEITSWTKGDKPTESEIQTEMTRLEAEFTTTQYQRDRKTEYPDMGTQLNKIYDDGLTKWKSEMVDPIKAKYPKP